MRFRVVHCLMLMFVVAVVLVVDQFARAHLQLVTAAIPAALVIYYFYKRWLPLHQQLPYVVISVALLCYVAFNPIALISGQWFPGDSWSRFFHFRGIVSNNTLVILGPLVLTAAFSVLWCSVNVLVGFYDRRRRGRAKKEW